MIYVTHGGETLYEIAGLLTLSPTYHDAIRRYNPGVEEIAQTQSSTPLPAGISFAIPDDWLKPGARATMIEIVGGVTLPAEKAGVNWGLMALLFAVLVAAGMKK